MYNYFIPEAIASIPPVQSDTQHLKQIGSPHLAKSKVDSAVQIQVCKKIGTCENAQIFLTAG